MDIFYDIVITDNNISTGDNIMDCKVVGADDILQEIYIIKQNGLN